MCMEVYIESHTDQCKKAKELHVAQEPQISDPCFSVIKTTIHTL